MEDNLKGILEAPTKNSKILSLISCCLNIKEQKWSEYSLEPTAADSGPIWLFFIERQGTLVSTFPLQYSGLRQ